jgi:hypothetical protein
MRDISQSDPHLLSKLMNLDEEAWPPDELAAMLRHQLRSKLESETFGDVLHAASPAIESLKRIKDFGKQHRNDPASPLPRDIATVLYFAAIAAALAKCGQRISQLDDASIRAGVEWAVALPWLDESTRALFVEGQKHVRHA